jgi:subtilisin family serine protease
MRLRAALPVAACVTIAACAQLPARDDLATIDASDRQILVMLRTPPPHFRPDNGYASDYGATASRGGQMRIAQAVAQGHGLRIVSAWPMPALGVDCVVMETNDGSTTAALAEEIGRDARVESAQAMNVFRVLGHDDPLYPLQPSARVWHLADVHRVATGRDIRIAEIDTGVEADHPDLLGRVAVQRDFVGVPPAGSEAHGTAVAGIIAARADDGIGIAGIAPEAELLALRACRQAPGAPVATCTSFTLAKALQFALEQNVQVINLSLGGPRDRLLERLLDAGLARHVAVVAAADARASDGGFPASHPGVIAVASEGSDHPPEGAMLAPGRDIPATMPGQAWGFVSGSSYAAAQVSGAVALVLEHSPGLDSAQLRRTLASGTLPGATATVDVCSAVARTTRACVCGCMVARDAMTSSPH